MKRNFQAYARRQMVTRRGQEGTSLLGVLVAVGISGVLVVFVSQLVSNGVMGQKKVEEDMELNLIRDTIARHIDCAKTLAQARAQYGNSLASFCNASSTSGPGLLSSKPIRLFGRTNMLTTNLDASKNSSGRIGSWWIRAGCDASQESLVIRAARFRSDNKFATDKLNQNKQLSWTNDDLILFGAAPGQNRLCMSSTSSIQRQTFFTKSTLSLSIPVPAGTQFTEVVVDGQYQGTGDIGADTMVTRLMVNHATLKYSGTQMVKIGSVATKSQTVAWNDTQIGQLPVYLPGIQPTNDNFYKERIPVPSISGVGSPINTLTFKSPITNPGNNNQRWWGYAVTVTHYN